MKLEWTLTLAYLRKHKKQFVTSVCCLAFFMAAMVSIQMFQTCYDNWLQKERFEEYGYYQSMYFDADLSMLTDSHKPKVKSYGVAAVMAPVQASGVVEQMTPYIGYLESDAAKLLNTKPLQGDFPKQAGEIAVEQSVYDILGLTAKVGEQVELPLILDGKVQPKTYRLAGILSNYMANWQREFSVESDLVKAALPGILTVKSEGKPLAAHILLSEPASETLARDSFGGRMSQHLDVTGSYANAENIRLLHIMGAVLVLVFAALIVIAAGNVSQITMAQRKTYVSLLRCIGATRKQAFRLFLLQGICLAGGTVAVGLLLGLFMLWAAVAVLNRFSFSTDFVLSLWQLLLITALCVTAVLLAFLLPVRGMLKKEPLDFAAKVPHPKKAVKASRFTRLWLRANRPGQKRQSWLTVLLTACSMMLLVFGPFYADFLDYASCNSTQEEMKAAGMDYWYGLAAGGTMPDLLDTEVPRGKGVSAAGMERLKNNPNLSADFYDCFRVTNAMLLTFDRDTGLSPAVQKLKEQFSLYSQRSSREDVRKRILYAGYPADADLIHAGIGGISYDMLEKLAPHLQKGSIDRAQYESGAQVAVFDPMFQVGERLTVTVPEYPGVLPSSSRPSPKPKIHTKTVTVGAVYDISGQEDLIAKRLSKMYTRIAMSDRVLFSMDQTLGYDEVCLTRKGSLNDAKAMAKVTEDLRVVASKSYLTSFLDYTQLKVDQTVLARQEKAPYLLVTCVFMATILNALMITTNLKVKSSLRSFPLLRAIGMDGKQLNRLLFFHNLGPCALGVAIGTLLGACLCLFISIQIPGSNSLPFYRSTVLPSILLGSALILLICYLSYLLPKRWILRQPITEAIDGVAY